MKDMDEEPFFNTEVLGGKTFDKREINKQVFRNHNAAAGVFTRLYLVPPKFKSNDGVFVDLGLQGDFAVFRNYMVKFVNGKKDHYANDYAFNPFSSSAFARIGWKANWSGSQPALFFRYRMTDAFNKKALPMDLPPITVGLVLW